MQSNNHPNEWVQYTSHLQSLVQNHRDQNTTKIFVKLDQLLEISSPKLVTSQGRDITGGIQSKFVYQSASPNYYEPLENQEVEENTNINVLEENEENYLQSSKYVEAQVNVLDEVLQSYSYKGNPELDQTRHATKT